MCPPISWDCSFLKSFSRPPYTAVLSVNTYHILTRKTMLLSTHIMYHTHCTKTQKMHTYIPYHNAAVYTHISHTRTRAHTCIHIHMYVMSYHIIRTTIPHPDTCTYMHVLSVYHIISYHTIHTCRYHIISCHITHDHTAPRQHASTIYTHTGKYMYMYICISVYQIPLNMISMLQVKLL